MNNQKTQRFEKLFQRERRQPLCQNLQPKEWGVESGTEPLNYELEPTEAFGFVFDWEIKHNIWQKVKSKLNLAGFHCKLEEATKIPLKHPFWQTFCLSKVKCYTNIIIIRGKRTAKNGRETLITVVVMQNIKIAGIFSFKGHHFETTQALV